MGVDEGVGVGVGMGVAEAEALGMAKSEAEVACSGGGWFSSLLFTSTDAESSLALAVED